MRELGPKTRYRKTEVDGRTVNLHRLIAERALGRPLRPDEQVHHINGDRLDNRPENLEVTTAREHGLHHHPPVLPTVKTCEACSAQFTPHKTKRRRQKACSWACRNELIRRQALLRGRRGARA